MCFSKYKFGVEMEMFLELKCPPQEPKKTESNCDRLVLVAEHIAAEYNSNMTECAIAGCQVGHYPIMARTDWQRPIYESFPERWEINNRWEIHDDASLHIWGISECVGWPLEFASPIFNFVDESGNYPWKGPMLKFFEVLENSANLFVDEECSTQVSISCNSDYDWDSLEQIKSLCRAILYFEEAVKKIVPECRRDNCYAKWNSSPTYTTSTITRTNDNFRRGLIMEKSLKKVDDCKDVKDIVRLMNPGSKRWSWNFIHLETDEDGIIRGRVEFRSPPGVDCSEDCFVWIHFAMEFVHAAVSMPTTMMRLGQYEASPDGLFEFFDSVGPLISAGEKEKYREVLKLDLN